MLVLPYSYVYLNPSDFKEAGIKLTAEQFLFNSIGMAKSLIINP
jgi:hypothetical protein